MKGTNIAPRHRDHTVLVKNAGLFRGFVFYWRKRTFFVTTATLNHFNLGITVVILISDNTVEAGSIQVFAIRELQKIPGSNWRCVHIQVDFDVTLAGRHRYPDSPRVSVRYRNK
jgi:hypothetical protein